MHWRERGLCALIAVVLLAGVGAAGVERGGDARDMTAATLARASTTTTEASTTTSRATTTTTAATTTTTRAPTTTASTLPPTTAAPPSTAAPAPVAARSGAPYGMAPYQGLGAWVDVYDWSVTHGGSNPGVTATQIDDMAARGVQTLYIQPGRWNSPTLILEPDRLNALIARAHARGMRVVAWYLPDLRDPADDRQHLTAIIERLDIDGLGIDIESTTVSDVDVRNHHLLALSSWLRQRLPNAVLSAIVLPPVQIETVNPNYWPRYPWAGLAKYYDVWQPMSYWTFRKDPWRDAHTYTAENIDRIRQRTGDPDAVVHSIGGIGDLTTAHDVQRMVQACSSRGCIGGSLYDYRTTHAALWSPLQAFRR